MGAQPLPRLLELAASKAADSTAFDHPGARATDDGVARRHGRWFKVAHQPGLRYLAEVTLMGHLEGDTDGPGTWRRACLPSPGHAARPQTEERPKLRTPRGYSLHHLWLQSPPPMVAGMAASLGDVVLSVFVSIYFEKVRKTLVRVQP